MNPGSVPDRREPERLTVENRLPPGYPQRVALEAAIRSGLVRMTGRWNVVLEAANALVLTISVVAPDGSAWTMTCCNPEHRQPESIAETVRAACGRRRWLGPGGARRRKSGGGEAGAEDLKRGDED